MKAAPALFAFLFETPLSRALSRGHRSEVEALLAAGANPNATANFKVKAEGMPDVWHRGRPIDQAMINLERGFLHQKNPNRPPMMSEDRGVPLHALTLLVAQGAEATVFSVQSWARLAARPNVTTDTLVHAARALDAAGADWRVSVPSAVGPQKTAMDVMADAIPLLVAEMRGGKAYLDARPVLPAIAAREELPVLLERRRATRASLTLVKSGPRPSGP